MSELSEISCDNCIFYDRSGIKNSGYCRRYPRTVVSVNGKIEHHYPLIGGWEKCGEFREDREAYTWPR